MNRRNIFSLLAVGVLGMLLFAIGQWWFLGREIQPQDCQDSPGEAPAGCSDLGLGVDCRSSTVERCEELRQSFDAITVAFSNRQANVMREIFSSRVADLQKSQNVDLEYILREPYHAYVGELFRGDNVHASFRPPLDFVSAKEFEAYGKALLELGLILGDSYVAKGKYAFPKQVEAMLLHLLVEYRKKFEAENSRGLAVRADALIATWLQHIESEQGYSRGYMRWQFAAIVGNYLSSGKTRLDAAKAARLAAVVELTTFCDYTPGWAGELESESSVPGSSNRKCTLQLTP